MRRLPEPIPPPTCREDALGRLRIERWHAEQAGERRRVDEIDRQIAQLSAANSPAHPGRETTTSAAPKERRATTPRKKPTNVTR